MRRAHAWAASSVSASSVRPTSTASTKSAHVTGPPHGTSPSSSPSTVAAMSARTSSVPSSSGVVCPAAPAGTDVVLRSRHRCPLPVPLARQAWSAASAASAVVEVAGLAVVGMRGERAGVADARTARRARPHRGRGQVGGPAVRGAGGPVLDQPLPRRLGTCRTVRPRAGSSSATPTASQLRPAPRARSAHSRRAPAATSATSRAARTPASESSSTGRDRPWKPSIGSRNSLAPYATTATRRTCSRVDDAACSRRLTSSAFTGHRHATAPPSPARRRAAHRSTVRTLTPHSRAISG